MPTEMNPFVPRGNEESVKPSRRQGWDTSDYVLAYYEKSGRWSIAYYIYGTHLTASPRWVDTANPCSNDDATPTLWWNLPRRASVQAVEYSEFEKAALDVIKASDAFRIRCDEMRTIVASR